jgi:hypothetical protein
MQMRSVINLTAACMVLLAFGFFAEQARAGKVALQQHYSPSHMKTACTNAGGSYMGPDANGGGYGCIGDNGTIVCDEGGRCTGYCEACGTRRGGKASIKAIVGPSTFRRLS